MSTYNHQEVPVAYPPPPPTSYPPPPPAVEGRYSSGGGGGPYVMAPPPIGYPTKHGYFGEDDHNKQFSANTTSSRGDGFWKGCFAALCCCCVLDACF